MDSVIRNDMETVTERAPVGFAQPATSDPGGLPRFIAGVAVLGIDVLATTGKRRWRTYRSARAASTR
jgi:hypothetical protein